MHKYRFFVSKWSYGRRTTRRILDLTLAADSLWEAYDTVAAKYGVTNINSCWPV